VVPEKERSRVEGNGGEGAHRLVRSEAERTTLKRERKLSLHYPSSVQGNELQSCRDERGLNISPCPRFERRKTRSNHREVKPAMGSTSGGETGILTNGPVIQQKE